MKTEYLDQEIEALEDACSRNCKDLWIDKLNEFKAIKEALSMVPVVDSKSHYKKGYKDGYGDAAIKKAPRIEVGFY